MANTQSFVHDDLLQVTRFDRVSSGLSSANLVLGLLVFAMLLIWLTNGGRKFANATPPFVVLPTPAMVDEETDTDAESLVVDMISGDEMPELISADSAPAIQQVTQALSSVRARDGIRLGLAEADVRRSGKLDGIKPLDGSRANRWEIQFNEMNQDEYFRVLEHFEARLFVVRKSTNEIVVVSCQKNPKATISNRRQLKDAFYFVHETTHLQVWDKKLASQANVNTDDSFFAICFPSRVLARLAELEQQATPGKGRSLAAVRQSIFEVVRTEAGFDFALNSQVLTRTK